MMTSNIVVGKESKSELEKLHEKQKGRSATELVCCCVGNTVFWTYTIIFGGLVIAVPVFLSCLAAKERVV